MKIIATRDLDLARWPIGSDHTCGQYDKRGGCGTTFVIETRSDWFAKSFPQPTGQGAYESCYARCPNCGREVYLGTGN